MLQIGLYWILYHLVLWHAIFLFRFAEVRLTSAATNTPFTLQGLYAGFVRDFYPIVVCALGTLPIVVLDMMKLTHRVAGPLVRFRNVLRDLSAGKQVAPLRLRKGDLLLEFQDEFNKYLEHLSARGPSPAAELDEESSIARQVDELCHIVREDQSRSPSAASQSASA